LPERDNIAVVRGAMDVLQMGGAEGLMNRYEEFMADRFEWRPVTVVSMEGERTFVGKMQFGLYWREFTGAFGDPQLAEMAYEELGDGRVLATGRLKVRGAASGVPIDREAAYVFTVVDGLITAGASFMSRREAEEFLAHA
jgi:ketosteroid isomerase-like protein